MSEAADDIDDRDSQKPWESQKIPHLEEDWDNAPPSKQQNSAAPSMLTATKPLPSLVNGLPFANTTPKEKHDLVTLKHKMSVGNFDLSQTTEFLTITPENNPQDNKVIKRQTRKITDNCQSDLSKANMSYEVTVTSVNGQDTKVESKTDMCFQEIERFHEIWYQNWCPEMTEDQVIKAGNANQPGIQAQVGDFNQYFNQSKKTDGFGGSRMGGSRMGGSRMGGSRMGGSRMGGSRMAGSRMAGSKIAGSAMGGQGLIQSIMGIASGSVNFLSQLFGK